MRYKIKFYKGKKLIRETSLRFIDWNNAEWFLITILKYKWIKSNFRKQGIKANIIAANGIPF